MITTETAREVIRTITQSLNEGQKFSEALVGANIECGVPIHQCAWIYQSEIKKNADGRPLDLMGDRRNWPTLIESDSDIGYADVNIVDDSLIGRLSQSIARTVQFPVNTAFLHALGVVAAACTWKFKYDIYGTDANPVNLYVITSQPPSTGKSAVNQFLTRPMHDAAKSINDERDLARASLNRELAELAAQIKKTQDVGRQEKLEAHVSEIQKKIHDECGHVRFIMTDGTAEALEQAAFNQSGMINIISDEADAVNVVLGGVYRSGGDSKANHGLILKAWDGGYHSSARITREGGEGFVRGSIAVIAQDDSIDSVIKAGLSGRGISERILLLREANLLGKRNHQGEYVPVDKMLLAQYAELIRAVMTEPDNIVLSFDAESHRIIAEYRQAMECELQDTGKYSNTLLRGAFGKADKQIHKIACILHIADQWSPGGKRSETVTYATVGRAIAIYDQLKAAYIDALQGHGAAGEKALKESAKDKLKQMVEKRRKLDFSVKELRDACNRIQPFKNQPGLTRLFRDELLPSMANDGTIAFYDGRLIVSPLLIR